MRIGEGADCSGGSGKRALAISFPVPGTGLKLTCTTMDRQTKSEIKVTDKRIFTAEGEIREEFREEIKAGDPFAGETGGETAARRKKRRPSGGRRRIRSRLPGGERRNKSIADKAQNPGTPFADFVEPLIAQAYVSLGMLRDPYGQKPKIDVAAARQMIEMLTHAQGEDGRQPDAGRRRFSVDTSGRIEARVRPANEKPHMKRRLLLLLAASACLGVPGGTRGGARAARHLAAGHGGRGCRRRSTRRRRRPTS